MILLSCKRRDILGRKKEKKMAWGHGILEHTAKCWNQKKYSKRFLVNWLEGFLSRKSPMRSAMTTIHQPALHCQVNRCQGFCSPFVWKGGIFQSLRMGMSHFDAQLLHQVHFVEIFTYRIDFSVTDFGNITHMDNGLSVGR